MYPNWDGTSPDRGINVQRVPSVADWDQITLEVIRHQAVLRNSNIYYEMPNYYVSKAISIKDRFRLTDIIVIKTEEDGAEGDLLFFKNGFIEVIKPISLNVLKDTIIRAEKIFSDLDTFEVDDLLIIESRKVKNCQCSIYIKGFCEE